MFLQFTNGGRWYVRNARGQIVSKLFDSYEDLVNSL